jgi:hypothetical protein
MVAQVKNLDKAGSTVVMNAALEALQAVAKEYGCTVSRKGWTYGGSYAKVSFEFALVKSDGSTMDSRAVAFVEAAGLFGLKPTDLGRIINIKGELFKITGFKPRSTRYPVVLERVKDSRTFSLTLEGTQKVLKELGQ